MTTGAHEARARNLLGAACVFDEELRVLLLRRSVLETFMPGHWGVPCGKLDFREDPRMGAERELLEETAVRASLRGLSGYSQFASTKAGVELDNLQLNFVFTEPVGHVELSSAHDEFAWFSLEQLHGSEHDEFQRSAIVEAHAYLLAHRRR